MYLPDVVAANIDEVSVALELIEKSTEGPNLVELVINTSTHQERAALTKGMFIAVRILFGTMHQEYDIPTLRAFMSSDAELEKLRGKDVSVDYKVIDLLDAIDGDGGSFYLQLHSIKEPIVVIVHLLLLFKKMCYRYYQVNEHTDALNALPYVQAYVNQVHGEMIQRDAEEARFITLMKDTTVAIEDALRLIEVLSPHWTVDRTEDGEKVFHLSAEAIEVDEVRDAVIGTRSPQEQVELLRGVCLVTSLFLSMHLASSSIVPIVEERRWQLDAEANPNDYDDDDYITENHALDLLESVARFEDDDFYQKAYGMDDIYGLVLVLNSSLIRTGSNLLNMKPKDIVSVVRKALNK